MKIILKDNVDNLGYKDDVVTVKDGYGRNYLIPRGLATMATTSALKMHEETLKQRAVKNQKIKEAAVKSAEGLKTAKVVVGAKAGENGKIFGSVNTIQLADAIEKLGFTIDKKSIKIKGDSIKTLGTYDADIRLHKDVEVSIKFDVVEDK